MSSGTPVDTLGRTPSVVPAMQDLLDASSLAPTLRDPAADTYFELPFSWDWDGVPVHGTIDLTYRDAGGWHVLDFKTDNLQDRSLVEAASPYLSQLAFYASALERATGQRPVTGLLFLRTGDVYVPTTGDLGKAMAATRARIEVGQVLDTPTPAFDDPRAGDV